MPFRRHQSVPMIVECDTSKISCENEKPKNKSGKGLPRNTSSGQVSKLASSPKMGFRSRSTTDLQSKGLEINIDSLPPLKPLRGCLSSGSLCALATLDNNSNDNLTSHKRNVSFGDLVIREHPRTLCGMSNSGPLLTLDWYNECDDSESDGSAPNNAIQCKTIQVSVEDYENTREPRRPRPPLVSKAKRERLLKKFGITDEDLLKAEKERDLKREAAKKQESNILDVMGKVVRKTLKSGSNEVQKELDILMKRSAKAEQIKKMQFEKYIAEQRKQLLANCEAQIKKEQKQKQFYPMQSMDVSSSDGTYSTKSSTLSESFIPSLQYMENDDALDF